MLPVALENMKTAKDLEAWDSSAVLGGAADFNEPMVWVAPDKIAAVCRFLKDTLAFERLVGVSCIDRHPVEPRFELLYLLHSVSRNERFKLKVSLPGSSPAVESVCGIWTGANWYEREVFDLFGVSFTNHPDLRRILMPEEWEGHPLRKDFPVHGHKYSYQNE